MFCFSYLIQRYNIICYITNRDKINNTDTLSNINEVKNQFKVK